MASSLCGRPDMWAKGELLTFRHLSFSSDLNQCQEPRKVSHVLKYLKQTNYKHQSTWQTFTKYDHEIKHSCYNLRS